MAPSASGRIKINAYAYGYAALAAMLYGISSPAAKSLLEEVSPMLMAALLYLGAGFGMLVLNLIFLKNRSFQNEANLPRRTFHSSLE